MIVCLMYRNDVSPLLRRIFAGEVRIERVDTLEALSAAADKAPVDLVCWDRSVPDAEQPRFSRVLRCDPALCRAAFVCICGPGEVDARLECTMLHFGLEEVLRLPLDDEVIRTRLENAMRRRRQTREVARARWLEYMEKKALSERLLFACEIDLYHGTLLGREGTALAEENFLPLEDYFSADRAAELVYPEDLEKVRQTLSLKTLLTELTDGGQETKKELDFRIRDRYEQWTWVRQELFYVPDRYAGDQCFSAIYLTDPVLRDADIYERAIGADVLTMAMLDLRRDVIKEIYKSFSGGVRGTSRSYRENYREFLSNIFRGEELRRAEALLEPESIRQAVSGGPVRYQLAAVLRDRGACRVSIELSPYNDDRELLVMVVRDVTQLFEQQQTLVAAAATKEHLDTIMRINPQAMSTFRIDLTTDTLTDGASVYPNLRSLQARGTFSGYVADALPNFSYSAERREFAKRFSVDELVAAYEKGCPQVAMRHHYMISDQEERILVTIVNMMKNKLTGNIEGIVYTLDETREWYSEKVNQMIFSKGSMGALIVNVKKETFIMPQENPILPFPVFYQERDFREGYRTIADICVAPEERERFLQNGELSRLRERLDAEGGCAFNTVWLREGRRLTVRLSFYYLDESRAKIIGVVEDVTEVTRREREQVDRYREALFQAEEATRDKNLLIAATRAMFPMCISVNLTQNTYYMLEYEHFNVKKAAEQGCFDDLISIGVSTVPDGEKQRFADTFSRKSLLAAFERGEKTVSLIHGQVDEHGVLHRNRTTVVFAERTPSGDVLEVTVTDCLDEQVKTEELLKRQETELKAALAEAEKANRAKSDFLSSMSHDIRTPLNAIINLTSLLHEELDDPERLETDIQKIEVAGEFLLQLINDILDVSKIESGRMTLIPRVYTYETFLNYIKGIIVPLCEEKDVRFVLDEGPTALDIYMDRVRFHQIFFNILSNAVKYTPPGGTVTFRTTNNVIHDGVLTCDFIVEDTGCGMSPEFLARAFEPFEREDSQNAYVGTGLGLTICKRLVDLMGGTIRIESEPGRGTRVTVHMDLRIATEEQRAESQAELNASYHRVAPADAAEGRRILVAEDNIINQEILTRLLEKKDYQVDTAENGQEAVNLLRTHPGGYYQVVLMDIRMPVMDGIQAAKLIRQEPDEDKCHIPIIAITANAFESDAQECLDAGMNAHLSKPIAPASLYALLAAYIHTEDTLRDNAPAPGSPERD